MMFVYDGGENVAFSCKLDEEKQAAQAKFS